MTFKCDANGLSESVIPQVFRSVNKSPSYGSWICCQIGAREHYAVPRVLEGAGLLGGLVTDAWVTPGSLVVKKPMARVARLQGRYHAELCFAKVQHFTLSTIGFELRTGFSKVCNVEPWARTLLRNKWFQMQGVASLKRMAQELEKSGTALTLFAYSYAALELFRFAKARGWRTILGQIDGGRRDEEIIEAEHGLHREIKGTWHPAPPEYWNAWYDECALADDIVVNSPWSARLLTEAGIVAKKLHVISVAYERGNDVRALVRAYPEQFSDSRRLRVLFLGAFALRKGAAAVLRAIRMLKDDPVEFWVVGAIGVEVPVDVRDSIKVKWIGPVARTATSDYYRKADVFVFPTMSDGFGMTQVEARGWKLPIIATPFCAPIVKHGVNGIVIAKSDGDLLADAIRSFLTEPYQLNRLSDGVASEYDDYSFATVRDRYLALNG